MPRSRIGKTWVCSSCAYTLALLGLTFQFSCAQKPAPAALHQTFEGGDEGWIPYGNDTRVEITHQPAHVKSGTGALALHYSYNPGQYGSAVLPLDPGQFARLSRLRLWVKTDLATPVIFILSEKQPGGGYYSSWFWCSKDQWQHVELTPADFSLNEGPTDPKDSNGRLDLDRIQGAGISDLGQAFQAMGTDPAYPILVDRRSGPHTLYIDDLDMIFGEPSPRRTNTIGDLNHGVVTWITMGGAQLIIVPATNPLRERALQADYNQLEARYVVISHGLSNLDLRGARKLAFRAAATNESKFLVYLEKRSPGQVYGPRYSLMITVPGGRRAVEQTIALADFHADTSGPSDPEGRLDAARLKSISFMDITAAYTRRSQPNTLWLSAIQPH